MLENARGLIKALENWAKKVTSGYKDVAVRDLSTSFRDGLAFCAIIHHYRPDLIDFQSLSKENIFENNSLAFSVAEKQLGVPALLDADDMVKYAIPDRLSIITYLSQLRNCFENQNKVKKHDLKRIQKSSPGPPAKISVVEPSINISRRHEVCQVCKHRVFILERLMVDGKLYHTTCFRCHKCNTLLNPGAYVEGDTPGSYECSVCPDEAQESLESFNETVEEETVESDSDDVETPVPKPVSTPEKEFTSKEAVSFAKSNLNIGDSVSVRSNIFLYPVADTKIDLQTKSDAKSAGSSVKDRISAFEKNQVNEKPNLPSSTIATPEIKLQYSPVESRRNKISPLSLSSKLSPEISTTPFKSPEKSNVEFEKEKLPKKNLFAKDFLVKENFLNGTAEKDFDIDKSDDNSSNSNISSQEVPILDSKSPSIEYKSLSREDSTLSIKSGSESPKSPKVPRDIFKSSLQPLKLSLSSSIRKETIDSPITSSESKKSFDIPQIKSSSPVTLPRSNFGRTLSLTKEPVDIEITSSESNLSSNNKPEIVTNRRSSLESSSKELSDKSKLEVRSFQRANSSYEISSSDETDSTKNGLKNYTSVYKSLYNSSSLSNRNVSKFNSDNLLTLRQPHEASKVVSEEIKPTKNDVSNSDILLNSISNNHEQFEIQKSTENLVSNKDLKDDTDLKTSQDFKKSQEEEDYPDDLNPFGDEDGEAEKDIEYPSDLNPFGDDDEVVISSSNKTIDDYDESKNPFASDDDEAEIAHDTSISSFKTTESFNKSSNLNDSVASTVSSPSGSLKGTFKKRQAPKPPNVKDIFPKDASDSGIDSSNNSMKLSPAITKRNILTSSPKVRKSKPAPPPPPPSSPSLQDPAARVKLTKETDNMKLKSSSTEETQPPKVYKKKKRPAPPVPVNVKRDMKKIPLKEIMREMKEIEEKQREYESQGREIELLIRNRDKDEEPSVEEEEYIMQLFELVNQKNALFRRQAELMYIKRSQRLEEQQYKIEAEIRQLMEKPESEKTDEDKSKEEELTMELIDIVDQRNSIIDSIEMDRRRELEEDHSVQEQFEMKNAELKQKSGKNKKNKAKKDKKKQEDESGKGTLKKKKHLFSKKS